MTILAIENLVTVSVSEVSLGVNQFNTSNIALFTTDTPDPVFTNGFKIYLEPTGIATDFGSDSDTYAMALAMFSQQPNFTFPGGRLIILPFETSETLAEAITRAKGLVSFFGVLSTQIEIEAHMLAAAAVLQANTMIGFFPQIDEATVEPDGALDMLEQGGFTNSRGLLYESNTALDGLKYAAGYAGRMLSVNFGGSNTTLTANGKSLKTILPANSDQTTVDAAKAAGADVYVNVAGTSMVLESGKNNYFDQSYNIQAFASAIKIALANTLIGTNTKIPQTDAGIATLTASVNRVCRQFVANGYLAPGAWNSPTTFGDPASLISNVASQGYYIFTGSVADQSQADRVARKAPLIQVAAKEAGAVDSASVIITVEP